MKKPAGNMSLKAGQSIRQGFSLFIDKLVDVSTSFLSGILKSVMKTHCCAPAEVDDTELPYGASIEQPDSVLPTLGLLVENAPDASTEASDVKNAYNVEPVDPNSLAQDYISFSPVLLEDKISVPSSDEKASDVILTPVLINDGRSL